MIFIKKDLTVYLAQKIRSYLCEKGVKYLVSANQETLGNIPNDYSSNNHEVSANNPSINEAPEMCLAKESFDPDESPNDGDSSEDVEESSKPSSSGEDYFSLTASDT